MYFKPLARIIDRIATSTKQTSEDVGSCNSDCDSRQVSQREIECDPSPLPNNVTRRYRSVYIPGITR